MGMKAAVNEPPRQEGCYGAASTKHSAASTTLASCSEEQPPPLLPHWLHALCSRPVMQALVQLYWSGCVLRSRWKVCGGAMGRAWGL